MTRVPYQEACLGDADPASIFAIVNPSTCYPTCIGEAVTYGRRCKRIVAGHKVASAQRIVDKLAAGSSLAAAKSSKLYDIADLMLCYQHVGQSEDIVREWKEQLRDSSEAESEEKRATTGRGYETRDGGRRQATGADIDDLAEKIRMLQEELRRMKAAQQEDYVKTFPSTGKSSRYTPFTTSYSSSTGTGYSSTKREESEDEYEDEYEEDIAERQRREAKERAERIKEAARRKAEAAKLAEKRKWSSAWNRYDASWYALEDGRLKNPKLPWPVVSGEVSDVTASSVREFFRRAMPVDEDRFRLLTRELKRWHTDKLLSLVGQDVVSGGDKARIDVVTKTIVQLWKEAKLSKKQGES
ncbi:hypothetical protein LIA77_11921 [Sarocladium implicatum]|nr:hypothetical protein LIA77_11921 [Sarocladium implicatum]